MNGERGVSRGRMGAAVLVAASPERVFAVLTDWPRHHEWMLLTTARQSGPGRVEAFTGVGRLGFLDTMTIVRWQPPTLVRVRHTGRLVRGEGVFRVKPYGGGSRVIWAEELELPLGAAGRLLWPLARPFADALARLSLRRLARLAE
ncbi:MULTISPECIES: SRPBCC family protein [unclassified Nonomuraea]|uniref:SRPBCC family protein n=1 Tax=unclassified Nonomuraea TaxID=2593643 RepID=UPI0033C1A4FE